MAEHLALAVGDDEAQISDWDRTNDRLRTLGVYPAGLRSKLDDFYPLAGYPLTVRLLDEGSIAIIDADDPDADAAEAALLRAEGMRGLVMLPLIAKGEAIGLVELKSSSRPTSDPGRIALARTMAHEAAMVLENARLYETARNLADRDPLTGYFNHRYLHERLSEEVVRAVRNRQPLSVIMLDLDDFKLVNDTFGHVYGDRVLAHVADLMRSTLRASDVAARYGGDEFALILPETGREDAARTAARILEAFQASPFAAEGRQPFPIGASIGIATHPFDGRSATELIAAADAGMYDAKDAGGNRALPGDRSTAVGADGPGLPAPAPAGRRRSQPGGPAVLTGPVGSGDA
jgi:diguanylate cyclase (GGDEF)-like protein